MTKKLIAIFSLTLLLGLGLSFSGISTVNAAQNGNIVLVKKEKEKKKKKSKKKRKSKKKAAEAGCCSQGSQAGKSCCKEGEKKECGDSKSKTKEL